MTRCGVTACVALLALAGCSDQLVDVGPIGTLRGETVQDSGSPVRRIDGEKQTYPYLGTVPARPTDLPSPDAIQADITKLENTRSANRKAAQTVIDDPRIKKPLAVPPKPKLEPGKAQ